VALGDMPHVAPATLRALADALAGGAPIAAPVMDGRRGNPVGFGRVHLEAAGAAGRPGRAPPAANLSRHRDPGRGPGIFRDIDTPADL
jgi:molybdenum cofactor cytidylyltransferase